MKNEEENFLRLLHSVDEPNIRLAFQILSGSPQYMPYLQPYAEAWSWWGRGAFAGAYTVFQINTTDWLRLEHREIDYVPESIGLFASLEVLDLTESGIKRLPPGIGQLSNLVELQLNYNKLVTLPPEIGNLQKLENIALIGNKITELPESLGRCKNLQAIWLGNMPVSAQSVNKVQQMLPKCNIYVTVP